jgi:hypothetical protein
MSHLVLESLLNASKLELHAPRVARRDTNRSFLRVAALDARRSRVFCTGRLRKAKRGASGIILAYDPPAADVVLVIPRASRSSG